MAGYSEVAPKTSINYYQFRHRSLLRADVVGTRPWLYTSKQHVQPGQIILLDASNFPAFQTFKRSLDRKTDRQTGLFKVTL